MADQAREAAAFDAAHGGEVPQSAEDWRHSQEQNLLSIRRELANTRSAEARRVLEDEYNRVDNLLKQGQPKLHPSQKFGLVSTTDDIFGDSEWFTVEKTEKRKDGSKWAKYNGDWHQVQSIGRAGFNGKPAAKLGRFKPTTGEQVEYGAGTHLGGLTAGGARVVRDYAMGETPESAAKLRKQELGLKYPNVANTPYAGGRASTLAGGATGMLTDPLSYLGLRAGPLGMAGMGGLTAGGSEAISEHEEGRELSPGRIALTSMEGVGTGGLMGAGGRMLTRGLHGDIPDPKTLTKKSDADVERILTERRKLGETPTGGDVHTIQNQPVPENILDKPISLDSTPIKTPEVQRKDKVKQPVQGHIVDPNEGNLDDVLPRSATLPQALRGAKPRYAFGRNQFELDFESDIDRAAYITAQKEPSKRDGEYLQFVMRATGMSAAEVRAYGARVRDSIKGMARDKEEGGRLRVPNLRAGRREPPIGQLPEPTKPEFKPVTNEGVEDTREFGPITLDDPVANVKEFPDLPKNQIGVEPSGKPRLKGMPRPAPKNVPNYETDTLLTAIAKLGGIKTGERLDLTGETKGRLQRGILHVFNKNGKSSDEIRELLVEHGYIPPEAVADDGGMRWLQEAISDEANGLREFRSLRARNLDEIYSRMRDEQGKVDPVLLSRVAGGAVGGVAGSQLDDDPVRGGFYGAVLGAAGGGGAAKRFVGGGFGSALNASLNPAAKTLAESRGRAAVWEREAIATQTGLQDLEKAIKPERYRAVIAAMESGKLDGLDQAERALAITFRNAIDQIGGAAQQVGLIQQLRKNHVPLQLDWEDKATRDAMKKMGYTPPEQTGRSGFSTFTPHQLERTFDTYQQAESLGLKPKNLKPSDIFASYANSVVGAIENKRAVQELMNLKDASGAPFMVADAQVTPQMRRAGWKPMSDIAPHVEDVRGMYIHPDLADSVKLGLSSHDPTTITRAALGTAWAAKRALVSGSFFHANNLLQAAAGAEGIKGIPYVADVVAGALGKAPSKISLGRIPEVPYESAVDAALKTWKSGDTTGMAGQIIDLGIRNGLKVGAAPLEESQGRDAFHRIMKRTESFLSTKGGVAGDVAALLPKGMRKVDEGFQKLTFDYTWTGLKLSLFSDLFQKELLRNEQRFLKGIEPRKDMNEIARTVSTHVNSVLGGQDWQFIAENVATQFLKKPAKELATPQAQAWEHILTLAPDWNISAIQPWLRAAGVSADDKDLIRLSQQYVAWSTFYSMTAMAGIQYKMTGTFPWQNDFRPDSVKRREGPQTPAQKLHDMTFIDLGNGQHAQVAKHWAEMPHLAANPQQFAINKAQPMMTEPVAGMLNQQYLSTHGAKPITKAKDWQSRTWDYLQWIAGNRAPIGVRQFSNGLGEGLLGIAGVQIIGKDKQQAGGGGNPFAPEPKD